MQYFKEYQSGQCLHAIQHQRKS